MNKWIIHIIYFALFMPLAMGAQELVPMHTYFESKISNQGSLRPYILKSNDTLGYILDHHFDVGRDAIVQKHYLTRKVKYEHFANINDQDFNIKLDPVFDFGLGIDHRSGRRLFQNSRGGVFKGAIGKKIFFSTIFVENQAILPQYTDSILNYMGVVPGQGMHRPFSDRGYDYSWAEGIVSIRFNQSWQMQFGHGRRFVGYGYRSLFYTDNTLPNLYLNMHFEQTKWKYDFWVTSLLHPHIPYPNINEGNFQWMRKMGSFHYIQFTPNDKLELSYFQGSIYKTRNVIGKGKVYIESGLPVPLLSPILDNGGHISGLGFAYHTRNFTYYAQLPMMYEYTLKMGYQLGAKYQKDKWYGLLEMNLAQAEMYRNVDSIVNYTHFNQPIAHPLGDNFIELVGLLKYDYKFWETSMKVNYYQAKDVFPAQNIYWPVSKGIVASDTDVMHLQFKQSYLVNMLTNLRIEMLVGFRSQANIQDTYLMFSFKHGIGRRYLDL